VAALGEDVEAVDTHAGLWGLCCRLSWVISWFDNDVAADIIY